MTDDPTPKGPPHQYEDITEKSESRYGRRQLIVGATAAGVGVVAGLIVNADPADAANGAPVLLGRTNNATAMTTVDTTLGNGLQARTSQSFRSGVYGIDDSPTGGHGVAGTSTHNIGVYGVTRANSRSGVFGFDDSPEGGSGVHGTSTNGAGVSGSGQTGVSGSGVTGVSGTGVTGVYGETGSIDGSAVHGYTEIGTGVFGESPNGVGVYGNSFAANGVLAESVNDNAVYGSSTYMAGIAGVSTQGDGVSGTSFGNSGSGVYGLDSSSGGGYGVYGESTHGMALYANGNAEVTGHLTKPGGSFKIDHPLDPANKYLYHSFVESPDMMNVYNGTVILDADGRAEVDLPEWFQALNRDFRYQLTAMDGPAPDLHISRRVTDRMFGIAGGHAAQEVSWQVTGIRQDAWANAHRIPVEVDKPAEDHGRYLHPDLIQDSTALPINGIADRRPSHPASRTGNPILET
jgi:hypothetical protein